MRERYGFFEAELRDEEYIIKPRLTEKSAVHEHIANAIYQLLGVRTPHVYIGSYKDQPSLISEIMPGYKDLVEWLKGERVLDAINHHLKPDECIAAYKESERSLSIQGKENLLAAAIILEDTDVLGTGLRNIGLIEGQPQIIKIDPGESIFSVQPERIDDALSEFAASLSLDNRFIHSTFSDAFFTNNPQLILGNLHVLEFFHDVDREKLKEELAEFAYLPDSVITDLVIREDYAELLPREHHYLDHLAAILLGRKARLKTLFNAPESQIIPPPLAPVKLDAQFTEPLERIEYGASRPYKVKRIDSSEYSNSL